LDFDTVALSFLFDKHYSIIKQLGLKDSSRDLQLNGAISYLFYLYLVFHACAVRFDVIGNLVKFWVFLVYLKGLKDMRCCLRCVRKWRKQGNANADAVEQKRPTPKPEPVGMTTMPKNQGDRPALWIDNKNTSAGNVSAGSVAAQ